VCGRYAAARSVDDLASTFGIRADGVEAIAAADWNVAPTKPVTAVVVRSGRPNLTTMRWGLVPPWAADPSAGARLVNARLETVASKPAFREALARRRCLLPADGWYEWAPSPGGYRRPYYLSPPDGAVLALAGLWETWTDGEGRRLVTTTIVTGPAPADLRMVHDRAPVVLPADTWRRWLDPAVADVDGVLRPTPTGVVVPRPVGDAVGDVRANGPQLTEQVEVVEQPTLF
jgi:putative SOS response-associated peptidase YedK